MSELSYTIETKQTPYPFNGPDGSLVYYFEGTATLNLPDGGKVRVASCWYRKTEQEAREWLIEQTKADELMRKCICDGCGCPIDLVDNGMCKSCRDEAEEEYMDARAQDAYEYPDEATLISVYAQNARNR